MARPIELPYDEVTRCAARHRWFEAARALGWAAYLDSGERSQAELAGGIAARGRYDVIAAGPVARLVSRGGWVTIEDASGPRDAPGSAFECARSLLAGRASSAAGWPIAGGAIGYFGYELGRTGAGLPAHKAGTVALMPDAAVGLYPWTLVVDHRERRAAITSLDGFPEAEALAIRDRLLEAEPAGTEPFRLVDEIASTLERADYLPRAARVIDYIRAGDCYQANLSREFRARCSGDPWDLYRHLHNTNPAPMGAFLEYPFGTVLSSSPERFVTVEGREALTRPIKGTRRRRTDAREDQAERDALLASAKDRAENVMIVDLLRNDFSRVCEPGSVRAPEICVLESFATVHHLVSTVTGRLAPGRDAFDLLDACFPGGSITGAPKRRAMQVIDELEPHRREVYCGAIGYVSAAGRMDMNIPIRTTLCAGGVLAFYAGGGIVADSSPESEFEETEAKVAAIRAALERFAVPPGAHPRKTLLRRRFIDARDARFAHGREDFSREAIAKLCALPEYRSARAVLATLAIGNEWDTRPFAERVLADGKRLVLPRVVKRARALELYAVRDLGRDLVPGVWGIEEPDPARLERVTLAEVDFALVPALAADREGYRLGHGAGYFDRLLASPGAVPFRIVVLPGALLVERLPREPHDVPVDAVMTEEELMRIERKQS
jgi:para-aminobenzoate synthetase component 1